MKGKRVMLLCIFGPGGSGKSTLARMYQDLGFRRVRTLTTRPKRPSESETDYEFLSMEEFERLSRQGAIDLEFSTDTHGEVWKYGVRSVDFKIATLSAEPYVIVLNRECAEPLTFVPRVRTLYINVPAKVRRARMLARGDDPKKVEERLKFDASGWEGHVVCDYRLSDVPPPVDVIFKEWK